MSLITQLTRLSLLFGVDPRKLVNLRYLPRYFAERDRWKRRGGRITASYVILGDYNASAGTARGHYFHQDLLVAQKIFKDQPKRHIDVGSRVDGFCAHLASFREVEILDIRPMETTGAGNLAFVQADLMAPHDLGKTDSLSCLHAIEHFGLGRYTDRIDPEGHISGINNLISLLEPEGKLYISFPIGINDEVHFNAHRVFHPETILSLGDVPKTLNLVSFDYVDDKGFLHRDAEPSAVAGKLKYGCGIYCFQRRSARTTS